MIYVEISFLGGQTETKEFHTPKKALSFMFAMRNKGHFILSYRCDDYMDHEWLDKRFKL